MVVDRPQLERFRAQITARLGLQYDDGKLDLLEDALRTRMQVLGEPGYDAYERRLLSGSRDEIRALAALLTIGETYFFRYRDAFRAFVETLLPERARARLAGRQLRILSVGCASGEEVYSLAILLREHLPDFASWQLSLTGIDVNAAALEKARRARYSAWSLRDTPAALRIRWFREEGRDYALHDEVRSMVTFEERNLVDDAPSFFRRDAFDIVFFRNVMIYFTPALMAEVIARIARSLSPGGYLFLGHAETLRGLSDDFRLCETQGTFYYQRREGEPGESPRSARAGRMVTQPRLLPDEPASNRPLDTSWADAIQVASERIARLAQGAPGNTEPSPLPSPTPPHSVGSSARDTISAKAPFDPTAAILLLQRERFAEALALLPPVPALGGDATVQLLRAVLLTHAGRLAEAEEVCSRLIADDARNAGAHYVMALCREQAGDTAAALRHDRAATELDASFVMPHLHLGLLARRAGDSATARRELGQAFGLLPAEDATRIVLFGGGFSREALAALCRAELRACGGVV